jgi:quercetin dioxygenase-like cupin family protein
MKKLEMGIPLATALLAASVQAATDSAASEMQITRAGDQQPFTGPAEYFSGRVNVDPLFTAHAPSQASGAYVTFEPGARSAWHSHPVGQTLIVTAGIGRIQSWGGKVQVIRTGDVIWTPPGVKHWHGASPTMAMTHIAVQEGADGKVVDWFDKVTDAQYDAHQE